MNTQRLYTRRIWGSRAEHRENIVVTVAMLVVTGAYELLSSALLPDFQFNWFEFIGTWSGLVTVWLARTENVLCWPWGVVSAASLGYFFATIGLPGQQWLNWGYFLIIQFWAWSHWVQGATAEQRLLITRLTLRGRLATGVSLIAGTIGVYLVIDLFAPGSQYPLLDAIVVASSVVAQYLLGRKKVESWFLWFGPVNILSITLFYLAGAYTVTALYVAFLIHAYFALVAWHRSEVRTTISH